MAKDKMKKNHKEDDVVQESYAPAGEDQITKEDVFKLFSLLRKFFQQYEEHLREADENVW